MTTWYRTVQGGTNYAVGTEWMAAIPSGSTIKRVRFSWGFSGYTSSIVDMENVQSDLLTFGLVTTIGNGTEAVPNALSASGDAAPPTQRWLWWETRQPVAVAIDQAAGVMSWRDSGPQEAVDAKAQVLATGIPGGDTLNLWASWAGQYAWESSGHVVIWVSTAVLF